MAKIERLQGELFPRIGLVITNSRLPAGKLIKVYIGRAERENRIRAFYGTSKNAMLIQILTAFFAFLLLV